MITTNEGTTLNSSSQTSAQDNVPQPAENSICQTEEQRSVLNALNIVRMLEAKYSRTDEEEKELQEALDVLQPFQPRDILCTLEPVTGPELLDALCAVGILGDIRDREARYSFCLPGFSVAFLLTWLNRYLPADVVRKIYALVIGLQGSNRNFTATASLINCGKDRLYDAWRELQEEGFSFELGNPNAPGAGRKTASETFSSQMFPQCIAAGIPEEALVHRKEQELVENMSQTAKDLSGKELKEPDGKQEGEEHAVMTLQTATFEEASEKLEQAIQFFQKFQQELRDVMFQKLFCGGCKLYFMIQSTNLMLDQMQWMMKSANPERENDSEESADVAGTGFVDPSVIRDLAVSPVLFAMVRNTASSILGLCQTALNIWNELSDLNVYHASKELFKKLNFFREMRTIQGQWNVCVNLLKRRAQFRKDEAKKNSAQKVYITNISPAALQDHLAELQSMWTTLANRLTTVCDCDEHLENTQDISNASESLRKMKERLDPVIAYELSEGGQDGYCAKAILIESLRCRFADWMQIFDERRTGYSAAKKISIGILSNGFQVYADRLFEDFSLAVRPRKEAEPTDIEPKDVNAAETPNEKPDSTDVNVGTDARTIRIRSVVQKVLSSILELKQKILDGKNSRSLNSKKKEEKLQKIDSAVAQLEMIYKKVQEEADHVLARNDAVLFPALEILVFSLSSVINGWLERAQTSGQNCALSFGDTVRLSSSVVSHTKRNTIQNNWTFYENTVQAALANAHGSYTVPNNFVFLDSYDEMDAWFRSNGQLSPEKRCELIRKLWESGKDPTSITSWLSYIIENEYNRNYGDPTSTFKCCRITYEEFKAAIRFLTGIEYSGPTLARIVQEVMGYSFRQSVKLDQIGKPHPLREQQSKYIESRRDAADLSKTLILSVDTKAFIVLGRLKHDNGLLLCSADGQVYRLYDHDFPFTLREVYGQNGTSLVDASRLDEKAILRPVGAYCPTTNEGFVSLVLGKDTAESMTTLIEYVINEKKKTMPELEKVLILADGGGANSSNGILWSDALLNLTDSTGVTAEVCHFTPGFSRHNPVEHALFSYISINWKGKPFLTIEHVIQYIRSTSTHTSTKAQDLKVECWFDNRHYMTNKERKALGLPVLTREELNFKAGNRIVHPFEPGTDMYKWNYTVYPSSKVPAED